MKILVATRNLGKVREIRELTSGLPVEFVSLRDFPELPDVVEDGETFEANALKKARFATSQTGIAAIADDSGLCVDALNGKPGVHSARYAGSDANDQDKYGKILEELIDVPEQCRTARFVCVLALVLPSGKEHVFQGTCEGFITKEPIGRGGFGYDPIFYFPPAGMTFGEMDMESKNMVSHRGNALRLFSEFCRTYFG